MTFLKNEGEVVSGITGLAADKVPFTGYHMPCPAIGYLETGDTGFRYVAASYQMNL